MAACKDEPSEEDGDISTPSSAVAVACKSPVKAAPCLFAVFIYHVVHC